MSQEEFLDYIRSEYERGRQQGMAQEAALTQIAAFGQEAEEINRDALVVNLMRELKMNKHLARGCADVVMQMIYEKRNVSL
jgi:proline dehydrogenase